jgi:hypothetical protein
MASVAGVQEPARACCPNSEARILHWNRDVVPFVAPVVHNSVYDVLNSYPQGCVLAALLRLRVLTVRKR